MSLETAKAFMKHIEDTQAAETVIDAFDMESSSWNLDKLVEHGEAAGFDFSSDDISAAIGELPVNELSEDDLDQVAGGFCSGNGRSSSGGGGWFWSLPASFCFGDSGTSGGNS